jgi:uncharacterized 2Fe-2S/4Fe-4S cluster protein (DUF4445 family)
MESHKLHTVRFIPIGTSVDVPQGTTLLEAARQANVPITSDCGGDGACGKCRVVICEGQVDGGSTEAFTREEIRRGYVLACEGRVREPVMVAVLREARLGSSATIGDEGAEIFSGAAEVAFSRDEIDPLVTKHHLVLPPPSLDDNAGDLDRLTTALRKRQPGEFQMGLKQIQALPGLLRNNDWDVTATAAYRGSLTEIVQLEAGDMTAGNLGLVVDLGTTTVVAHLVDLRSGETLGATARYNGQVNSGADVIHRILVAEAEGVQGLQQAAVNDINALTEELMQRYHVSRNEITVAAIAGNTTMLHLLLGLDPSSIRREPYVGASYSPPAFRATEIGLRLAPRALLYCLPMISSFIGADIVAGVMATGMDESESVNLMIDIGTNGEVVIGNREWLMCASASAGPAFEGSQTRNGMRAQPGAIDHVKILDKERLLSFSTVGSAPPRGICGSGYIDLLAELLRTRLMDRSGLLDLTSGSSRIRGENQNDCEYVVIRAGESGAEKDIVITQTDIRSMLLAKAAIYTAARLLLQSLGLTFDDVDRLYVAGAFGNYLGLENAIIIGLLPDMPLDRIRSAGNTAIAGTKLALLSKKQYERARDVAAKMTYLELGTAREFMDEFVSAQFFPHTDVEQFPTAAAALKG